jgi:predicted NAD/FAD-binding protein
MKIAIIGAGISGLTCAYLLNRQHDIKVFEAEKTIGGHTATKDVLIDGQHYPVDTGFIVYNDWTYPNFIKLMDELGVDSHPTEMSFSVRCEKTGLEYGGNNLNTLFAQRSNLLNASYIKMLFDIMRFNREAVDDLTFRRISATGTLGEYLQAKGYGDAFINHYLIPMGSAIWSAPNQVMLDFPLLFFVRFFKNHGLLSVNNRPQWRVISGGSRAYLEPLARSFNNKIYTSHPVSSVIRSSEGASVQVEGKPVEHFDQVVFACHSDQALKMLADPSPEESALLGAIPYSNNEVVLHTDASLLPKRQLAWSSWNYLLPEQQQTAPVLTYNMNILQGIDAPVTFCVSLNTTQRIDPEKILGQYQYAHPVFSLESVQATNNWSQINGVNRSWFCGAYWGNGFHEDGVNSALKVTRALGVNW